MVRLHTHDLALDGGREPGTAVGGEDHPVVLNRCKNGQGDRDAFDAEHHPSNLRAPKQVQALGPVQVNGAEARFISWR